MTKERRELGGEGEALAAAYLRSRGYRIVERNFRTPLGEIDLIAEKGDVLRFIEVKARRSMAAGGPFEQITPRKRRQILRAAMAYCQRRRLTDIEMHFDVIGLDHSRSPPTIDHLADAFDASDD